MNQLDRRIAKLEREAPERQDSSEAEQAERREAMARLFVGDPDWDKGLPALPPDENERRALMREIERMLAPAPRRDSDGTQTPLGRWTA